MYWDVFTEIFHKRKKHILKRSLEKKRLRHFIFFSNIWKKYYVAVLNIYFKKAFNPFTMDVTSFKGSIEWIRYSSIEENKVED